MASDGRRDQGITRRLTDYVAASTPQDLPDPVRHQARRALLNIVGCTIGGSGHEVVTRVKEALRPFWGPHQATLVAQGERADVLHAAYINCLSSCVDSFDDGHAEAIVHPSGSVASVLLALGEQRPTTGAAFLHAFALGMEANCRVAKAIAAPPARGRLAWVQTPVVGGLGAALAAAKLLGLDGRRSAWAIGLAGAQAAGYRGNHGTMNMPLMPAQAARAGLHAALLAERGVTSSEATLETRYGFCEVFAEQPNPAAITDRLGEAFDLLGTTYKPYPCGIVLNPIVEACLRLKARCAFAPDAVERIHAVAHPTALAITNDAHPADPVAAQVSLQHWAAVTIAHGSATTQELSAKRIADPVVVRLRELVDATEDPALADDSARVTIHLAGGETESEAVEHCIGSAARPMTDGELEDKFRGLAHGRRTDAEIDSLIEQCWRIERLPDIRALLRLLA